METVSEKWQRKRLQPIKKELSFDCHKAAVILIAVDRSTPNFSKYKIDLNLSWFIVDVHCFKNTIKALPPLRIKLLLEDRKKKK